MSNAWPSGADAWTAYAARCTAHYPLMFTDWNAHADMMRQRRNAAINRAVDAGADYVEPSLSPEDEETAPIDVAPDTPALDTLF